MTCSIRRFPLVLALLATLVVLPTRASDGFDQARAASAFENGNQLFRQGDYQGALDAYNAALSAGYASGALYHNLGSAYFRLDELGQAIRFYEKARRLLPEDPTLLHDLDIARSQTVDGDAVLPEPYWVRWWRVLRDTIGIPAFFWTGLLLYFGGASMLGYRLLTGNQAPWLRRILTASGGLGILLLATAYAASLTPAYSNRAVIISEQAPLLPAPGPAGTPDATLHEGALLTIEDEEDGWLRVRLPSGVTGWVEAGSAGVI